MMQEVLLLPQYAESLQERREAIQRGIVALQQCMTVVVDSVRSIWNAVIDAIRPAFQALTDALSRLFRPQPVKRTRLSKQSRRYLMVKRRERARKLRHGRKRSA